MKKFSIPVATVLLAITGAFASQSSVTQPTSLQKGWIDAETPCSIEVACRTEVGPVCTMLHNGQIKQAFGKNNPKDATCPKTLYKVF